MFVLGSNKSDWIGDAVTEMVDDGAMTIRGKQQEDKFSSIVDLTIGGKARVARERAKVDPRGQLALLSSSPSKDSRNQSTDGDEDAEASDDASAAQEDLADTVMGLLSANSWTPQKAKAKATSLVRSNSGSSTPSPAKHVKRSSGIQSQSPKAAVGANSAPQRSVQAQAMNGPNAAVGIAKVCAKAPGEVGSVDFQERTKSPEEWVEIWKLKAAHEQQGISRIAREFFDTDPVFNETNALVMSLQETLQSPPFSEETSQFVENKALKDGCKILNAKIKEVHGKLVQYTVNLTKRRIIPDEAMMFGYVMRRILKPAQALVNILPNKSFEHDVIEKHVDICEGFFPIPVVAAIKHRLGLMLGTLRVGTSDEVEKLIKGDVWIGGNAVSDACGRSVNKKGIELALPKIVSGFNAGNADNLLDTLSTIGETIDEHCEGFFSVDDSSDLGRKIHYAGTITIRLEHVFISVEC